MDNNTKPYLSGIHLKQEDLSEYGRVFETQKQKLPKTLKNPSSGVYLSSVKGRGMEFDEVRVYQPGDDARNIDWRVTARTGKAYTKIFREERERPLFLLLDQGESMFFGTRRVLKSVQAANFASLIGWDAIHRGDRVGLMIFAQGFHQEFKARSRSKHYLRLLNTLVTQHNHLANLPSAKNLQPSTTKSPLEEALKRCSALIAPGSLIYLLSDFYTYDEACKRQLALIARHSQVRIVYVSDPLEVEVSTQGRYPVSNGKESSILDLSSKRTQQQFLRHFQSKRMQVEEELKRHQIRIMDLSTTQDISLKHLDEMHAFH